MSRDKREIILITGAGRGIGAAIAKRLADNKRVICINYHKDEENAERVADVVKEKDGQPLILKADVSDEKAVKDMFERIDKEYSRLDALVNNASPPLKQESFLKLSWGDFQSHLDVLVKGAFNCSIQAVDLMKRNKKGHIINILTSCVLGAPPSNMAHYVTAKYALMGLSRSLGTEVARFNIRVNMISPYLTKTDLTSFMNERYVEILKEQHPLKRLAEPQDTAEAVAFLLSDRAPYINLTNIPVTGGAVS